MVRRPKEVPVVQGSPEHSRRTHHERNQLLAVRPEPVEGLIQRFGWATLFCPPFLVKGGQTIKLFTHPTIFALIALALSGNGYAGDATRHYKISAQSLNNALMRFAADSNLELVFTADKVRGLTANSLDGIMTADQALTHLLQGSGMTYRFINAHSVTLEQQPGNFRKTATTPDKPEPQSSSGESSGEGQMMPKVTVEADAEYDPEYYADPYNKDYVLPNSSFGMKTDTPIMETPLNVQTVSKGIMKDQQAVTLKDVFRNVSGISANANNDQDPRGNNTNITIRGFQAADISRNGIRQQKSGGSGRQLANVESVDVLKGPSAILMGLVEPGGMVNVITKQALATPYYGFTQQFGSYDFYRTTLDATGPLNKAKDLLYRVNLSYENSGSFRDFVGNDDVFLAPVFKWVISPKTQVTFEMEYEHQHQARDLGYFIPTTDLSGQPILDSNGKPPNIPINRNYAGYNPYNTERIFGSFNWSHQFNDDWTLKHRFSVDYNQNVSGQIAAPFYVINNNVLTSIFQSASENTTYSTNLDLIGHFDTFGLKHTLLTGGDYYRTDSVFADRFYEVLFDRPIDVFNPVFPGLYYKDYDPNTGAFSASSPSVEGLTGPLPSIKSLLKDNGHSDQYGLYIQDQIKLPYNLHVTGGIRYQYYHQNNVDNGKADDAVTPRVGILWQAKPWLSLYATYTESFGPNQALYKFISQDKAALLNPTSAKNYEGGIKTEFFDGKLRATLSYFDLTKTNVGVQDADNTHICQGGTCLIEVGEINSRGPELDIQGEILPGWNVIANWSNTDIRVSKSNPEAEAAGTKVGDRQPSIPRNIGRLWTTYEVQSGDFQGLNFGGGLNFTNGTTQYTTNKPLPSYITADLMAGYSRKLKDVTLSFQFNVDNLLDKRYVTSSSPNPYGLNFLGIGAPRTFMGQVSVQY